MLRVLMIGPAREAHGGVAAVVNGYFDAGIEKLCMIRYLSTTCDGSKTRKFIFAYRAYREFCSVVNSYDIVHVHMALRASFTRKKVFMHAALRAQKKVILHIHEGEFVKLFEAAPARVKKDIVATLNAADKVIALSDEWATYFKSLGITSDKVIVLCNGVDVNGLFTDISINQNVLFLGRLDKNKSPDVLVRAAALVVTHYPNAQFFFAGNGDLDFYKALAKALKVDTHCHFLGWVGASEREALFQTCSLFCLPSQNEGMPMSVLEAMAKGLVALSTPVGGIAQLIKDGKTGLLFEVGDYQALAKEIESLFADPAYAIHLARSGYLCVKEQFNTKDTIGALQTIYEELV